MFKVEYETRGITVTECPGDIKGVKQILIGVVNNEAVENEAILWCSNAHWGDCFVNQKYKFAVYCERDDSNTNKLNSIKFMQNLANKISEQTGIKNKYVGEVNDSLTFDFKLGKSYMTNNGGKGLHFALVDNSGKEIWKTTKTDIISFIKEVTNQINKQKNIVNKVRSFRLPNAKIAQDILESKHLNKEYSNRIYYDGCWWIDMERFTNGITRFWVGYEDKRDGNMHQELFTVYPQVDGNLRYSWDGRAKQAVVDKILSLYKYMMQRGLV